MALRDSGSSALDRYLASIRKYRLLTRSEEEPASLDDLVCANLSFVVKIASEYRGLGVPLEDLLNSGNLGLIEASRRFDPARGYKFITYAVWWIRKAVLETLSSQASVVRVPKYRRRKVQKIRAAETDLSAHLGRPPTREELSAHLECGIRRIDEDLLVAQGEISLDDPVGENGLAIRHFMEDRSARQPEEELLRKEDQSLARAVLEHLNERERTILTRRYGMLGQREWTLKEIGDSLGMSRERIRQIEKEVLHKLRQILQHLTSAPGGPLSGRVIISRAKRMNVRGAKPSGRACGASDRPGAGMKSERRKGRRGSASQEQARC